MWTNCKEPSKGQEWSEAYDLQKTVECEGKEGGGREETREEKKEVAQETSNMKPYL